MITRSRSKMPRDDIKGIIEQTLEPIKAQLQSLPSKEYFDEVINRLEGRLRDQDDTIKMLTARVKDLEVEITKMQTLERRIDDIEQYGRRLCVRIDNMPVGEKKPLMIALTLLTPGEGVFHLQPSKWLRTPKRNKLSP